MAPPSRSWWASWRNRTNRPAPPLSIKSAGSASSGRGAAVVAGTLATHEGAGSWLRLLLAKLIAFWERREAPNNASYDYFRRQLGAVAHAHQPEAPLPRAEIDPAHAAAVVPDP